MPDSKWNPILPGLGSAIQALYSIRREPCLDYSAMLTVALSVAESRDGFIAQYVGPETVNIAQKVRGQDFQLIVHSVGLSGEWVRPLLEMAGLNLQIDDSWIGQEQICPSAENAHIWLMPLRKGSKLIGWFGLQNRPGGYSKALREALFPFMTTCAYLLNAQWEQARQSETAGGEASHFQGSNLVALHAKPIRQREKRRLYKQDIPETRLGTTPENLQENLKGAFNHASIGMALVSLDGRYMKVNPKLCEILGYSEAQMATKYIGDITHPDDCEQDALILSRLKKREQTSYETEKRYIHREGYVIWVLLTASSVSAQNGDVLYFVTQVQNITERKRIEQALRDSEENFRRAFDDASTGMAMMSLDGYFLKVNPKLSQITGYTEQELLSKNFQSVTYPQDFETDFLYWQKMLNGELQTCEYEKKYIHKQGHLAWILLTGSSVRDAQGNLLYFVAQMQDITERKRVEQALRDSEERFRSAFDYASIGMALVSPEGRWLKVNRIVSKITGYSPDELLTKDFQSITHPDDLAADLSLLARMMAGEIETYQLDKRYIQKNGQAIWVQLNVSPVYAMDGNIAYFIAQLQDIHDRKMADDQLRKAKEQAETVALAKAEFVATMSHEIRTPLNAVLGMTAMLEMTTLTEEQRELLDTIKSGSNTLLGIINDILDFSKIESGKMELDYHMLDMKACIEESFALFKQKAKSQGLNLTYQIDSDVPALIWGDSTRLRQILINLLGNAVKFTELGEVRVSVSLKGQPDAKGLFKLKFKVQDTGCGIPADKLRVIFDSFTQVAPAISRKYGGTGLGLAICNRLIQLMGGFIWVDSEVDKGSTFHFTILSRQVTKEAIDQNLCKPDEDTPYLYDPALAEKHPLAILVAEDNPVNQKLILHILKRCGYAPTVVQNGWAVLDALEADRYDVIFMDIQMPELDGLEACRRIIERYGLENRPRIIAMTAFGLKEDRDRCLEAGMDDYISKPISAQQVEVLLKRWHQWQVQAARTAQSAIDGPMLCSRVGYDQDILREMAEIFDEDCARLLSDIRFAIQQADTHALKRHAHELKGASLALSAARMRELAHRLEMDAKLQRIEQAPVLFKLLEAEFKKARLELQQLNQTFVRQETPVI